MSTINNINPAALLPPASTSSSSSNGGQTLTQNDFLKIMVAQFTQQDPLAGGSDGGSGGASGDYVTQLMNMTNLTTMQTMSSQQAMQLAQSLPGATVQLSVNGSNVQGVVQQTTLNNGTVYLTVGGQQYPSTDLISVIQPAAVTTTPSSTTETVATN